MYGQSGLPVLLAVLYAALLANAASLSKRSEALLSENPVLRMLRLSKMPEFPSDDGRDYPASWITLPIDHFNASDTRTFQNRYWYNSTFYEPGGPVFWWDVGESNAELYVPDQLAQASGYSTLMTMAERFKGLALLVEHRYYGRVDEGSFPFPVNQTTGRLVDISNYAYLTHEQALEDAVYIANHLEVPGLGISTGANTSSLAPGDGTPWVWIGGSYPGVRGALLRVRNPETFYVTWASSAPVQYSVDMWQYYAQVERSMPRNCSADYTAVTRYVDGIFANGTDDEVRAVKEALAEAVLASPEEPNPTQEDIVGLAEGCDNNCMASLLLLPTNSFQSYGPKVYLIPFCDIMETQNKTDVRTTDNGGLTKAIAPASGLALEHDIATAWNAFLLALKITNYDESPSSGEPVVEVSTYSWGWQFCTEAGFYQRGNPDNPHTIQSQFISLESVQSYCDWLFDGLNPLPNVTTVNKYGGWNMQPSNTMWTGGEYDPWRSFSPQSTEEGSPMRRTTQVIPACNEPPKGTDLFGMVYEGMAHVSDQRAQMYNASDPNGEFSADGLRKVRNQESYYVAEALLGRALEKWLPCYGAK
ncbi:hypothetical protein N0V93_009760 [Gnomoniopsis smithogilvyi]|uniref:Peptidase S28 n=1 Tax=Gnomoniopsis smithogilvyi TaxID=1191159 RepID=A0A9W9CTZ9_9PEZI|nr:hypothetical protein N0V93_009760 [Gnomoniopsis smithogilvyi]